MTARYGLLGRSLSHSLSPQIHAAFGEYPYDLIEKPEEALAEFFANPPYAAINVTIPYKKAVIPYRKLGLKKAVISYRKLRLKNGEMLYVSPFLLKERILWKL